MLGIGRGAGLKRMSGDVHALGHGLKQRRKMLHGLVEHAGVRGAAQRLGKMGGAIRLV